MSFSRLHLGIFMAISMMFLVACKNKRADMLLVNGIIHTMDANGTVVQACAIKDGKIIEIGRAHV